MKYDISLEVSGIESSFDDYSSSEESGEDNTTARQ